MDIYQTILHQFRLIEEARKNIINHKKLIQSTTSENAKKILRNQISHQEGIIRVARLEVDRLTRLFLWTLNNPIAEKIVQVSEPILLDRTFIGVNDVSSNSSVDIEMGNKELVFSLTSDGQTISWTITNPHMVDSIIGALQESRKQVFGAEPESES